MDYNILPDADLATFKHICNSWYKDKNHIWWSNHPLPDVVDISTFRPVWKTSVRDGIESCYEDSDYRCDKNHVYYRDSIIEGADPLSFWLVNLNNGNDWIAYDMKRIYEGKDTPAFRRYFKERYDCDFQQPIWRSTVQSPEKTISNTSRQKTPTIATHIANNFRPVFLPEYLTKISS